MRSDASRRIELVAGPISLTLVDGWLRWIRLGQQEVLRAIYVAVRDDAWDTVPGVIEAFAVEADSASFRATFTSRHQSGAIDFEWRAEIRGTDPGSVAFAMDGEAHTAFASNRIGICVLHPASVSGTPIRIQTPDGSQDTAFPRQIAANQPFTNIIGMRWAVGPGVDALLRFDGDSFETEDQRNWTDASFKTFSRPLRLPRPMQVHAGDRIQQSATLTLDATDLPRGVTHRSVRAADPVAVHVGGGTQPAPAIGTALAAGRERLAADVIEALRSTAPASIRVVLELDRGGWEDALGAAEEVVAVIGGHLEIEAVVGDADALDRLVERAAAMTLATAHVFAFPARGFTTDEPVARRLRALRAAGDHSFLIGGGSRADFAELNRAQLPLALLDVVGFAISAQVHAFDDASVVETLETHGDVIAGARAIAAGRPLSVGPVTLRPRFNASGNARPDLGPTSDPSRNDPRQWTTFAAAWTVGVVAAADRASVETVILHEATGPAGLTDGPAAAGASPTLLALRTLASSAMARSVPISEAPGIAAVGRRSDDGARFLVANLREHEADVDLYLPKDLLPATAGTLDGAPAPIRSVGRAVRIRLDPYGVIAIDANTRRDGRIRDSDR